ncbi:hypothetical protein PMAYCL1PPCAC_08757 [Pristionchus mayeri]|uniref:glucuronosyltransferase n=1 Tax=Pristionchus mayeri TaxID=1317129 RepID=A0AAN4ZIC1_9BILA|nr:hypothetical protein PMAYCL1PPCAC_08757 [Pristionchus mayeri]
MLTMRTVIHTKRLHIFQFGNFFGNIFATQCRALIEDAELLEKLKNEKYDVLFAEHFDLCGVGLVELIKPRSLISVASSTTFGPMLQEFGIPTALTFDPAVYVSKMDVHSLWDRLFNLYADFIIRTSFNPMRTAVHSVFKEKFSADFPTIERISSNSAFVFTNTEPLIDFAVPTISKVIPIGGLGAKEPKKLSEDWEKILEKRLKIILISFGSLAKSAYFPMKVKQSIIEIFKQSKLFLT